MKLNQNTFFTTTDLFNEIVQRVKDNLCWPDGIIDYSLAGKNTPICNYEFEPRFILSPGNSEGYYLDLWIHGSISLIEEYDQYCSLGTIKTLSTSAEDVMKMANLYGSCLLAYRESVQEHMDDMTRIGYDLRLFIDEEKKVNYGYSGLKDKEACLKKWEAEKQRRNFDHAIIRNNYSRVEEKVV